VPAHLALEYEFNYFVSNELDQRAWTFDQLYTLPLEWDELEVLQ